MDLGWNNAVDIPKNPTILSNGVRITNGKYLRMSGPWQDNTLTYAYFSMWFYHIAGEMQYYSDISMTVSPYSFPVQSKKLNS